jgi:hypothetical protein
MPKTLLRNALTAAIGLALAVALPTVALATPAPAFTARWGATGSGDGEFNAVSHVAADRFGNLYTADAMNHRVQKFTSAGVYESQWSERLHYDWHSWGHRRRSVRARLRY